MKKDINHQIIEYVRGNEVLRNLQASLDERYREWQQLAKLMRLEERFVINRWHGLRSNYRMALKQGNGHTAHFRYQKEMSFLLPELLESIRNEELNDECERQLPPNVIKPEFILQLEDIEQDDDREEYVFHEIERVDASNLNEGEYQAVVFDPQQVQTPGDTIIFDPQTMTTVRSHEIYTNGDQNGYTHELQQQQHMDCDIQEEVIVDVGDVESAMNQLIQSTQDSDQGGDIFCLPAINIKDEGSGMDANAVIENDSMVTEFLEDGSLVGKTVMITNMAPRSHSDPAGLHNTGQAMKRRNCSADWEPDPPAKQQCQMPPKEEEQYCAIDMDVATMYEEVVGGGPPQKTEPAQSGAEEKRSENEGNEDRIFFDLIKAMLFNMPTDKRRQMKREIMNLLLA